MRVLVIGSNARAHSLVWKLRKDNPLLELFCAPGNPGIAEHASLVPIACVDIQGLTDFALKNKIDLTIVGPEQSLLLGVVDEFERNGLSIIGPHRRAAEIEGSKVFSYELMRKYKIPCPNSWAFSDFANAISFLQNCDIPLAVKADGLTRGMGVTIADTQAEATQALHDCLVEKKFGAAGSQILLQEKIMGEEVSCMVFTDGKEFIAMPSVKAHKRLLDYDKGPTTPGMGAYSPSITVSADMQDRINKEVIVPALHALRKEHREFRGILQVGLMVCNDALRVLEFNCRWGNPETQVILPKLDSNLLDLLVALHDRELDSFTPLWNALACSCIVLTTQAYSGESIEGKPIQGLGQAFMEPNVLLFHEGTKLQDNQIVTSRDRVLNICAFAPTLEESLRKMYSAAEKISFDGMHYRKDIGLRAMRRLQGI